MTKDTATKLPIFLENFDSLVYYIPAWICDDIAEGKQKILQRTRVADRCVACIIIADTNFLLSFVNLYTKCLARGGTWYVARRLLPLLLHFVTD